MTGHFPSDWHGVTISSIECIIVYFTMFICLFFQQSLKYTLLWFTQVHRATNLLFAFVFPLVFSRFLILLFLLFFRFWFWFCFRFWFFLFMFVFCWLVNKLKWFVLWLPTTFFQFFICGSQSCSTLCWRIRSIVDIFKISKLYAYGQRLVIVAHYFNKLFNECI